MLARRIIPCLDIKDERVVKGLRFAQLKDAGDPIECAKRYEAQGADEIIILDITASHESRAPLLTMIKALVQEVFVPVTVGGGIRSVGDADDLLRCGADKISVNSSGIHNPELISQIAKKYGSQCVIVAIDAKFHPDQNRWCVYTEGGRNYHDLCAVTWAKKAAQLGAGEILLTSMDQDGTQAGFDIELTRQIAEAVPIQVIASGGAGTLEHLASVITEGRADAVLAASIFHYSTFTVPQAKRFLADSGIEVRL